LFAQEVMQDPDETFAKKQALWITALLSETRECSGQRESSSMLAPVTQTVHKPHWARS
jgi:hypothetical protein